MKFSKQWLLDWVDPKKSTEEICEQLTNAGLEVDFFEPAAASFSGIVTAEIIATEQHPDADKLKVCTVNAGNETLQIVCGGKKRSRWYQSGFSQSRRSASW